MTHPVMVKGLTKEMSDSQTKQRKEWYLDQMQKKAPDLRKTYYESVLTQLGSDELKSKITEEVFKKALIDGENLVVGDKSITIAPKRQEGFFVQCFNPTILLE